MISKNYCECGILYGMNGSSSAAFLRPEEVLQKIGLRAAQTFVHLGCGAGFWLIPAAKIIGAGGKAIGVDIRGDMLSECEKRAQLQRLSQIVQTVRGDLEHERGSTLPDAGADYVLIANIIHQADSGKLLTEGKRIVKTDGKIVIVEWDTKASPLGPPPEKRISEAGMKKIVTLAGLTVQEAFQASPYHYGLILSKT